MFDICIVGLGALGTIYGYLLERSGRVRVTAVCRSNYDAIKDRGIDIRSEKFGSVDAWRPARVVKTAEEAADRQYEFVMCTTKFLPDLIPTSQILRSLLPCTSTFVLIQNGIGVEVDLRRAAPESIIISGCAWIDATSVEGGSVVRHGRMQRLVLGIHFPHGPRIETDQAINGASQACLELVVELFRTGGAFAISTPNIDAQRWRKNLWNIGYSVFCTLTRACCATILSDKWAPTTVPVVRGFMEETVAIGRAAGLSPELLPDSAMDETAHVTHEEFAETYAPRTIASFTPVRYRPSMLVDLEAGRALEVEGIIGGVIRKGRELGVHAPRLETAYASLLLIQEPLLQGSKARNVSKP